MKQTFIYNFLTFVVIFFCISCAHQGNKMAAMEEDLTQESSGAAPETQKEEKNLTSLEAAKVEPELVAKNDVKDSESVESAVNDGDDSVAAMLELGNDEKSIALEEIKKVDVVPAMVVASEDKVNAELTASPAEVVPEESTKSEALPPAPGHERELSNDTKSSEPAIETEPVPAPVKKSPKKQGSENKSKKNRIETVGYPKAAPVQAPVVVASQPVQPVVAPAAVVQPVVVKQEPKLASAEIAEFMSQHYVAVGILVLLSVVIAFRLTRRSNKQDENFPL